jgi:hypothetical protein
VTNTNKINNDSNSKLSDELTDEKITVIGSRPPANSQNALEWANQAISNPMPISYVLRPISELLNSRNFPNIKNIDKISQNLKRVSSDNYCKRLLKVGKLYKCAPPNADRELAKKFNGCSLCKSCGGDYPIDGGAVSVDQNWPEWSRIKDSQCFGNLDKRALTDGIHVCCPESRPLSVGNCRLCTSCGGEYKHYGGSLMSDQRWENSTRAYSNGCKGSHSGQSSEVQLCCKDEPICQLCSSCGGDYQYELGRVSNDKCWPSFFKIKEQQCGGSFGNVDYCKNGAGSVNLCCKGGEDTKRRKMRKLK